MRALRIYAPSSISDIRFEEIARPQPAPDEVLVRVAASGLSPQEILWATSTGITRPLPATLGFEVSGVVVEVGANVTDLMVGMEVYGLPNFGQGGTHAEYVTVRANELAAKPATLSHIEAATLPLSGLTAWQCLFEQAKLVAGQTVLIHGAAGGVGIFAVQLARWVGARVIATASARNQAFVAGLGADEVLDYAAVRFEDVVRDVNVVLDTVGGDTLDHSWRVVHKGGIVVSIAGEGTADMGALATPWGVRGVWHLVHPSRLQLEQIATIADAGKLKPYIEAVLPLSEGVYAYEEGLKGHNRGKIVLQRGELTGQE